jgi:hypothetical protein
MECGLGRSRVGLGRLAGYGNFALFEINNPVVLLFRKVSVNERPLYVRVGMSSAGRRRRPGRWVREQVELLVTRGSDIQVMALEYDSEVEVHFGPPRCQASDLVQFINGLAQFAGVAARFPVGHCCKGKGEMRLSFIGVAGIGLSLGISRSMCSRSASI